MEDSTTKRKHLEDQSVHSNVSSGLADSAGKELATMKCDVLWIGDEPDGLISHKTAGAIEGIVYKVVRVDSRRVAL